MGDQTDDRKQITVRCSDEFKHLVKVAAAVEGKNLSEYIRDTMLTTAEDDLTAEQILQAKKRAREDAQSTAADA